MRHACLTLLCPAVESEPMGEVGRRNGPHPFTMDCGALVDINNCAQGSKALFEVTYLKLLTSHYRKIVSSHFEAV